MKIASLIAAYLVVVDGKPDGREQQMRRDRLYTPRHRLEMNAPWNRGSHARHLMDPPLAPSFERLQNLVDDVSQEKPRNSKPPSDADTSKMLPCLLRKEGCTKSDTSPKETKQDSHSEGQLRKTQASIEQAVSKLQKDLDRRTAEVVKEIERRAAEMRREIAIEAEELIEAVKYLVTMLADSVTRADEMGQNFVREWYDDAEKRYVGGGNAQPLDEQIKNLDKDLKETNQDAHKEMVGDLKQSVENTRKYYGAPQTDNDMPLDEQLGLDDDDTNTTAEDDDTTASTESQAETTQEESEATTKQSSGDSDTTAEEAQNADTSEEESATNTTESEETTQTIADTTTAEAVTEAPVEPTKKNTEHAKATAAAATVKATSAAEAAKVTTATAAAETAKATSASETAKVTTATAAAETAKVTTSTAAAETAKANPATAAETAKANPATAAETAKATGMAQQSGQTASVTTTPATESNGSLVTGMEIQKNNSTMTANGENVEASADDSGKKLMSFGLF